MWQQQLQLKYDPTRPAWNFVNINPNMPPYVPAIQAPIPQVGQYMPYISGVLAGKIQQNATQNPLRMTVFNLAAENNFTNAYFDAMATMAIELTAYIVSAQRCPIEQAIEQATEVVGDYFAAANVREYNVLSNYIDDPHIKSTVGRTIAEFDTVRNELANFLRQTPGRSNLGFQQQQSTSFQGGHTSYAAGQSGTTTTSFTGSSSLFEPIGGKQPAPALPAAGNSSFSQWNTPTAPAAPAAIDTPQPKEQEMEQQHLDAHPGNWQPNLATEPYFYAYNPREMNARLVVGTDGATYPDYIRKTESEQMDYDRHATPTVFGKLPNFVDITATAKTMERIAKGIHQLNGETLSDDSDNTVTVKTTVCDEWQFVTSVTDAWLRASLKRLQFDASTAPLPDVYRVYSRVADAVITPADEAPLLRDLAKCKSFLGLREKINALGGEMAPALYNVINQRMTDLVNRKLRLELGIKTSIGNFQDDIGELIDYLETSKKYGPVIKAAFLRDQVSDIQRNLQALSPELTASEAGVMMAGMKFPQDQKPAVTFVSSNYSLTYLDCLSWDLNVEVSDDIPVKLSQEVTPVFYGLVKGAFMDADKLETEDQKSLAIARVLMRTKDGRTFECTKGTLADEAYLITLID